MLRLSILLLAMMFLAPSITAQQTVQVMLTGMDQVPEVSTPATGVVDVTLKDDYLIVEGSFSDLRGNYTGFGIYHGREGQQGNQLFSVSVDLDDDRKGGTIDSDENRFELSDGIKSALSDGMLYLSITSDRHQQGEIRGQIPAIQ